MSASQAQLAELYHRDLSRLVRQIEAFPSDEMLWQTTPGVTNSAGTLALHLEGNLREYIGRLLGGIAFARDRDSEFSARGLSRAGLAARLKQLSEVIPPVVAALSPEAMEAEYPQVVLQKPLTTAAFLVHLYGHLNWHLGELDYLRRFLSGQSALPRPTRA